MAPLYRSGRSRSANRALAALPLLALLFLLPAPAPAATASELRVCTDRAWADYNTCLVESGTEWQRTGCDVGFSTDYTLCWARYIGIIMWFLI
jgi:hypothetical protein